MLVGRDVEKKELLNALASSESEFVAVYGRRRIGKTYLIRETFDYHFTFQHSGLKGKTTTIQLDRFRQSLVEQGYPECPRLPNWYKAFDALKVLVEKKREKRKVIFIDEMPWLDRPNSNFVSALENFWNSWASARRDILLIICGSASSWILKKVIYNKEGLHNRVTKRIALQPFTLHECEMYVSALGLELTREQIAECYMILGGVPFYWHYLQRGKSVAQNIDDLFFAGGDKLEHEFDELYQSLFHSPEPYICLVTALAGKKSGMTRNEISRCAGVPPTGRLTECLDDLEQCGFVRHFVPLGHVSKGTVYQLIDNFTLFYFQFIKPNHGIDPHYWSKNLAGRLHSTWAGRAFERLCLLHIAKIKEALGISGVLTNEYAWHTKETQIDLVIDRNDEIINICEMKFSESPYEISRKEYDSLMSKCAVFREQTSTKKAIHPVYVTAHGVRQNAYASELQGQVTLDQLF